MGKGIDKFVNILGLGGSDDDDDYDNDDLFDDEIDLVEPKPVRQPKKEKVAQVKTPVSSYGTSPKSQIAATYNEDNMYESTSSYSRKPKTTRPSRPASGSNSKVVSMNGRGSEVYVIKPQEFNEAQTVADFLKDGKTIVINMEGIELNAAQRIIDFICGACYALDGTLQAISGNIFIAAPQDIEVSGDLREEILNESTVSPNLGAY